MFLLGFLLTDLKELLVAGSKLLIRRLFSRKKKTFEETAPLLHRAIEELNELKKKHDE